MINNVVLVGRLVRDPEMRYTQNGVAVTTFTLAVDRPFVDANGERGTDFISIVAWRKLAEIAGENLKKGRQVAVRGWLQTRSYDAQNGQRRWVTEVVAEQIMFLRAPGDRAQTPSSPSAAFAEPEEEFEIADEDLPF